MDLKQANVEKGQQHEELTHGNHQLEVALVTFGAPTFPNKPKISLPTKLNGNRLAILMISKPDVFSTTNASHSISN